MEQGQICVQGIFSMNCPVMWSGGGGLLKILRMYLRPSILGETTLVYELNYV